MGAAQDPTTLAACLSQTRLMKSSGTRPYGLHSIPHFRQLPSPHAMHAERERRRGEGEKTKKTGIYSDDEVEEEEE